jgi:hypothetical protein
VDREEKKDTREYSRDFIPIETTEHTEEELVQENEQKYVKNMVKRKTKYYSKKSKLCQEKPNIFFTIARRE